MSTLATAVAATGLAAGIPVAFPDAMDSRVAHWGTVATTAVWHDGPVIPVVIEYTTLASGDVSWIRFGTTVDVPLVSITLL